MWIMSRFMPKKSSSIHLAFFPKYGSGLIRHSFQIDESIGLIITEENRYVLTCMESLRFHRAQLKRYLTDHPSFEHSFDPIEITEGPEVAKRMSNASLKSGVGPLAAVAGVLADLVAEAMVEAGAHVAVVENGGEIAIHSDRNIRVVIGAGSNPLSNRIGFLLEEFPLGIATSSGRHSHAFSMGDSDAVTVFADNAGVADAAATLAANMVVGEPCVDVKSGVEAGLKIKGVHGVVAMRDQAVSLGGTIPQIFSVIGGD